MTQQIPVWLREMKDLDSTDKYLYLCLLDILGEERLRNLCREKDDGNLHVTIDFLMAYTGLDELAIRKSLYFLRAERLVYNVMSLKKLYELHVVPWGRALGITQAECAEAETPEGHS